jgi:hypothetical protein
VGKICCQKVGSGKYEILGRQCKVSNILVHLNQKYRADWEHNNTQHHINNIGQPALMNSSFPFLASGNINMYAAIVLPITSFVVV